DPGKREAKEKLEAFYERILAGDVDGLDAVMEVASASTPDGQALDAQLQSPEAWELFARLFDRHLAERPGAERHAVWQATHAPLLRLLRTPVPAANVYHTLS